jgi:hypothetical protein
MKLIDHWNLTQTKRKQYPYIKDLIFNWYINDTGEYNAYIIFCTFF